MSENGYGLAPDGRPKGNKVWVDGCFDMVHFGHANQIRQSKQYGRYLIVGVHTDKEISLNKGPPVFTETERYAMVRAIRWVDEVVEGAPYTTTVETLDKHDCDFCLHGNDITLDAEGHDTYAEVKNEGRYRETLRTQGVSTSDLVGRMLLLTKTHHERDDHLSDEHSERARTLSTVGRDGGPRIDEMASMHDHVRVGREIPMMRGIENGGKGRDDGVQDHRCLGVLSPKHRPPRRRPLHPSSSTQNDLSRPQKPSIDSSISEDTASPYTRVSRFVATSRTILEFASGRTPKLSDRIVYVCGAFDLFHYGHLRFLEEARKLGDYLICGILGDSTVNSYKGGNHPIMSLHERVLTVLAYRPVDEVVIGAPYLVSDEMIDRFNISLVVVGCEVPHHEHDCPDAFEAAKRRGIYREVESGSDLTTEGIIERIIKNRMEYEVRNRKKAKKEAAALEALERLQGDTTKAIKITAEAAERAEPTRKWV